MPQPLTVRIDRALSNYSLAYMQGADGFVGTRVFPQIRTDVQGGKYWKFDKEDWFRDNAQIRPPATESAGGGFDLSTDTYFADVFAWHMDIADQTAANADAAIELERSAARWVADTMLRRIEKNFATTYMTTGVWATDLTPATLWSNHDLSTPLTDIETGKITVAANTGFTPNTLVVGAQVHSQLINHPDIVDRVKYTGDRRIDNADIARYFGVERYFVAAALQNTAEEGATAAYSFIHGKHALLVYSEPGLGWGTATGGAMMVWDGVSDGTGMEVGTVRIEMPLKRAVRIESQMAWDFKVVASDLGYFFNGAVA